MDKEDIVKKIKEEEDYIRSPKFANSLNKFLAKNPDGVHIKNTEKPAAALKIQNKAIARLLLISEEEVENLYQKSVVLLREEMLKMNESKSLKLHFEDGTFDVSFDPKTELVEVIERDKEEQFLGKSLFTKEEASYLGQAILNVIGQSKSLEPIEKVRIE